MIELRPHHLFCIAQFAGHGYDEAFTENMHKVIERLECEPIRLIDGADMLCAKCPNLDVSGRCFLGEENVCGRDENARKLMAGKTELNSSEVVDLLAAVSKEEYESVCGECRWRAEGLCSFEIFEASSARGL